MKAHAKCSHQTSIGRANVPVEPGCWHAGSKGPTSPATIAPATFVAGLLDVRAALASAVQKGGTALVLTVPWAAAYTTFLPRDTTAAGSQYFRCPGSGVLLISG